MLPNPYKYNKPIEKIHDKKLIERNIETPSTTYDSNKKFINSTNTDELSKDRINLFSAKNGNPNTIIPNNNVIIPFIPLKRPSSNFNFGSMNLWEKDNKNIRNNIFFENNRKIKERTNINSAPHQNLNLNNNHDMNKEIKNSILNNNKLNEDIKNLSSGKIHPKLHNIKLEKGMRSAKLVDLKPIILKKRNNLFCKSINSLNIENKFLNNNNSLIHFSNKKLPVKITKK